MKINVDEVLKMRNGEPLERATKVEVGKVIEKESITFKIAVIDTLETMTEADKTLSGIDKYRRGILADKIYKGKGETDFTVDEVKVIKDRVGEVGTTYIVKCIWQILGE